MSQKIIFTIFLKPNSVVDSGHDSGLESGGSDLLGVVDLS